MLLNESGLKNFPHGIHTSYVSKFRVILILWHVGHMISLYMCIQNMILHHTDIIIGSNNLDY